MPLSTTNVIILGASRKYMTPLFPHSKFTKLNMLRTLYNKITKGYTLQHGIEKIYYRVDKKITS
jgi:hypothetical protein